MALRGVGLDFKKMYNIKVNLKKLKLLFTALFSFAILMFPLAIFSADPPCINSGMLCNPVPTIESIPAFIKTLLEGVLKIGLPIITLAIIYCGFLFVKAQGAPEEIKKAKDALMYTLIGTAILLGSWAIAKLISDTVLELSINLLNLYV